MNGQGPGKHGWSAMRANKRPFFKPVSLEPRLARAVVNIAAGPNSDLVVDPMCGTGSTQVAALKNNRNAYGCELSKFFYEIALKRCNELKDPIQKDLFAEEKNDISINEIIKIARPGSPWRFTAHELLAAYYIKNNDLNSAQQSLNSIIEDSEAPLFIKERALLLNDTLKED